MARIALAAVIAGLVVFFWGAVAHLVLPLGRVGIQSLPNEEAMVAAMKKSVAAPGLYYFPGMDSARAGDVGEERHEDKVYVGPSGLLAYRPQGEQGTSPQRLLLELVSDILTAWIAALLLTRVIGGIGFRALFVGLMGVFGWLSVGASYWIWYGFPASYTVAEGVDQFAGWFLGGWMLAILMRPRRARAA